ncbi:MAG: glycoside hydrolase [Actinomycetota bacterium]|nr:glycoside hydrolase [Actinomycetota bacterium]
MKIRQANGTARFHHNRMRLVLAIVAAMVLTVSATSALAGVVRASAPRLVSGPDPLPNMEDPNHCGSAAGTLNAPNEYDRAGWETEPVLAVDPTDSDVLATAWTQAWADAIAVGFSTDGGETWSEVVPPTSICTPGGSEKYDKGALDPWLSFGPPFGAASQGIAYLSSMVYGYEDKEKGSAGGQNMAFLLNRSLDGGRTWTQPAKPLDTAAAPCTPVCRGTYLDTTHVVADPRRPGYAYAAWTKGDLVGEPPAATTRHHYVSHTEDAGNNWSEPSQVPLSQPDRFVPVGRLLALPDGTLVDVFSEVPASSQGLTGPTKIMASRSSDLGSTWAPPVTIADPADLEHVVYPSAAVAPDGTIYVSWVDIDIGESGFALKYSKSTNGGSTWCEPGDNCGLGMVGEPITSPPATVGNTFLQAPRISQSPALAVAADGTVGVAFYDHRNDPGNDPPKITDYWFRHSHNGGQNWEAEQHIAGPFDKTSAPSGGARSGGPGDLGGSSIAPFAVGFATVFPLAQPRSGANFTLGSWATRETSPEISTDIFFSRLQIKR